LGRHWSERGEVGFLGALWRFRLALNVVASAILVASGG